MKKSILVYKVETPLHMGSGSELSYIDLPIQREKVTGFPKAEASGIKGGFRRGYYTYLLKEGKTSKDANRLVNYKFGSDNDSDIKSSLLEFGDGKLLLFPVRSSKGVFKQITCEMVLSRYRTDIELLGVRRINDQESDEDLSKNHSSTKNTGKAKLSIKREVKDGDENLIIEDFDIRVNKEENYCPHLEKLLCDKGIDEVIIVSDDMFSYLTEFCTEVQTRIKIGDDGVVAKSGPFTEEYLPVESVLYSSFIDLSELSGDITFENYLTSSDSKINYIQMGGNKTLGKGVLSYSTWEVTNEDIKKV